MISTHLRFRLNLSKNQKPPEKYLSVNLTVLLVAGVTREILAKTDERGLLPIVKHRQVVCPKPEPLGIFRYPFPNTSTSVSWPFQLGSIG
jgi:hypothetical protein